MEGKKLSTLTVHQLPCAKRECLYPVKYTAESKAAAYPGNTLSAKCIYYCEFLKQTFELVQKQECKSISFN